MTVITIADAYKIIQDIRNHLYYDGTLVKEIECAGLRATIVLITGAIIEDLLSDIAVIEIVRRDRE